MNVKARQQRAYSEEYETSMCMVRYGGVAQLGEHLLCKQGVIGSIPIISTIQLNCWKLHLEN